MARWQAVIERLWDTGARIIDASDEMLNEFDEILKAGADNIIDMGAAVVTGVDNVCDFTAWLFTKMTVGFLRRVHDTRMYASQNRQYIIGVAMYFIVSGVVMVAMFAAAIDYKYAYNGKVLGIVHEQKDVVEILEMVSEELTKEYGLSINIDPATDIKFTPTVSYGKPVDDANTVLKRFTYMGDVKTKAFAFVVDNQTIGIIESEAVGREILDTVINSYLDGKKGKYEYVGIAEDVQIKEVSTKLAMINSKSAVLKIIKAGRTVTEEYSPKSGETVEDIIKRFDMEYGEFKEINPGIFKKTEISKNDILNVRYEEPILNVETVEVRTFAESVDYETEYKKSDDFYEVEKFTVREGQKGKQKVTARLTKVNGEVVAREDLETEMLTEPVNKIVVRGTKKVPPRQGTGTFIRPVNVAIYSGFGYRWGRMHQGIDLPASTGTPIHAADGGTVTYAGTYYSYGLTLRIDHGGGYETLYAHCSQLYAAVGEKVFQGQTIAAVGNTGRSTGPHLHFEVIKYGIHEDPANYV